MAEVEVHLVDEVLEGGHLPGVVPPQLVEAPRPPLHHLHTNITNNTNSITVTIYKCLI